MGIQNIKPISVKYEGYCVVTCVFMRAKSYKTKSQTQGCKVKKLSWNSPLFLHTAVPKSKRCKLGRRTECALNVKSVKMEIICTKKIIYITPFDKNFRAAL